MDTSATASATVLTTKPCDRSSRLVLLPLPFQGHINPMLQLANILHSKGFSITILHTRFNAPNPTNYPHFSFLPIPGVVDDNTLVSSIKSVINFIEYLNDKCFNPIKECLSRLLLEDEGVTCLITDAQWFSTQSVADELRLHRIVHRTSSVSSFLLFAAFPVIRDMGYFRQFSDEGIMNNIISV
ncbi:hypothetical protein Tco_1120696 [Tanacetum coccineum]